MSKSIKSLKGRFVLTAILVLLTIAPTSLEAREYPENRFGGFVAFTVFETQQVNEPEDTNARTAEVGLGTLSLSTYSSFEDTRFKVKLDVDGKIDEYGKMVEIAKISQKIDENLSLDFGKGKVRFHNYDFGVTEETYLDGGTLLGRYELNWSELDKKIMFAVNYRSGDLKSSTTLFSDTTKVISKGSDGEFYTDESGDPVLENFSNSVDPNDQFGVAQRIDYKLSSSTSVFAGVASYYHRLQESRNSALILGGEYDIYEVIVLGEFLYGESSQYRNSGTGAQGKIDWTETVARVQAQYRMSRATELLLNVEKADYEYSELEDAAAGIAYDSVNKGTLSKVDAGYALHVSSRVTLTTGIIYEHKIYSDYQNTDAEATAWSGSSSLTYAF
ncbi:hypothetical protein N9W79_01180 [bacterium]|nr:hypothetical protein [bacterium]